MIDLTQVTCIDNDYYYEIVEDLEIVDSYYPMFEWKVSQTKDNLIELASINLTKEIKLVWDNDAEISCIVDGFLVTSDVVIEEVCIKLTDYLLKELLIK